MIEPGMRRGIDVVRAGATLWVILFHVQHGIARFTSGEEARAFAERLWPVFNAGWQTYGVDALFMVSALTLTVSLLSERDRTGRVDLWAFYLRRLGRILPLYWLAVLVYGLAEGAPAGEILLSAAFIGFVVSDNNVVPVGWTMEAILIVYILLPFVVAGLARTGRPLLWIALTCVGTLALRHAYVVAAEEDFSHLFLGLLETKTPSDAAFELYFRLWFRVTPFLIGLGAGWLVMRHRERLRDWALGLPGLSAGLLSLVVLLLLAGWPVADPLAAERGPEWLWETFWAWSGALFALATAIAVTVFGYRSPNADQGGWVGWISARIFPIYLFHMPMILIAAVLVFRSTDASVLATATNWHVLGLFAVATALSSALAWPLHRYVEQPVARWLERRSPRRRLVTKSEL